MRRDPRLPPMDQGLIMNENIPCAQLASAAICSHVHATMPVAFGPANAFDTPAASGSTSVC
jgi:hypothetical protein